MFDNVVIIISENVEVACHCGTNVALAHMLLGCVPGHGLRWIDWCRHILVTRILLKKWIVAKYLLLASWPYGMRGPSLMPYVQVHSSWVINISYYRSMNFWTTHQLLVQQVPGVVAAPEVCPVWPVSETNWTLTSRTFFRIWIRTSWCSCWVWASEVSVEAIMSLFSTL